MHRTFTAAGLAAMLAALPSSAEANKVTGKVALPAEGYGPAPSRTRGFVERRANPYLPVKSFNPYPYLAVVLEGPTGEPEHERTEVPYTIVGQTFEAPLLVIQIGRPFSIKNRSLERHRLFSPQNPDLLDKSDVIHSGKARPVVIKDQKDAGRVFHIRSTTNPRMLGRVVAFEHPYFSTVDRTGHFEIENVPKGRYKVRVWYKDGWLPIESTANVGRGTTRVNDLRLPANLEAAKKAKPKAKPKAKAKGKAKANE